MQLPTQAIVEVSVFFCHKKIDVKILNVHKSNDGRRLLVNVELGEETLTLVNAYAPNDEKK